MVRAIVTSPEFWTTARARSKFKTPLEFVVSSVRAVGGSVGAEPGPARAVARLGQPLYLQPVPTGYEETEAAWANSSALFERMNVAVAIAAGRLPGVTVDLDRVGAGHRRRGSDCSSAWIAALLSGLDVGAHRSR